MALLALTGCPETSVGPDFGYKFPVLSPSDWNGVWKASNDDTASRFQVSDAKHGQITITSVPGSKTKKSGDEKPALLTLHVASTKKNGNLYFATIVESGDRSDKLTPFLVHRLDKDSFVFWTINNGAVEKAIKSGKLKGRVKPDKDGAHSRLNSDPENYSVLAQPQFWDWTNPTLMNRQKK